MPAGFNKGQIEYIKTIANVNGHKTYKNTTLANQNHNHTDGTLADADNQMRYLAWCLGARPLMHPVGTINTDTDPIVESSDLGSLDVYTVPIQTDAIAATPTQRVTPECFLESVNLKMRHIVNMDNPADEEPNSHKEFRLVVFRHKEKQHASKQLAENFSNPFYDMFFGAANTKYGPKGYRQTMDNQGNINYVAFSGGWSASYDRDAMMTDPINKDDYVVMKDCRYYLGREYGGKHIYEDRFYWDHEDPIATDQNDLTYNDSNKNYCWYIMLFGHNNAVDTSGHADNTIDNMGYVTLRANTHVTSG